MAPGGSGNHRLARRSSDEGNQKHISAPVQYEAGEVGQHEHAPIGDVPAPTHGRGRSKSG